MTTLAVNGLRALGSALVQTGKAYAVNAATSAVSRAFDDREFEGPRLQSFHLQTSRDGAPMPRVYGRMRLAGQVIWASHLRETASTTSVGGKGGGPTQTSYAYSVSFAIGLAEGEIQGVDRIWANGAQLDMTGVTLRVYRGTSDQPVDPIIAATEGAEAPAFRNTAYLVFEDFPLDNYGGRLPQINVEIVRTLGGDTLPLESLIESVCLLLGSGEWAYSPTIIERTPEPGVSLPVNMNNLTSEADFSLAIEQLQTQLPNCRNVSIINAWFGDSTDCGICRIRPGVETRRRSTPDHIWEVAGYTRDTAHLLSTDAEGRANFGGTPDEETLIAAIRALKEAGFSVTLYPFLMMDIPAGVEAAGAFPWRGRIAATPDKSASTRAAVNAFFTGEGGYRDYILSQADLAQRAGGVDRFVIGSELVGLTRLRDQVDAFPAVEQLSNLATTVKARLGANTELTYAADWSEYFGYHPQDGSGDVFYHLDPLWANSAIAAVGIDAYFPLSDWRDGGGLDAEIASAPYDPDYLAAQVEGGEGYDWYYASTADRDAQIRTPIDDPDFRYKDLRHWWSQPHYERRNGQKLSTPTLWQPESKPFWLTEIGCPAVRFGANQPNVFPDTRSVDGGYPYFSDGSRDDLMQRSYLETLLRYWSDADRNAGMIDISATSVWAWDARPYPDFPARLDVWSDGGNWQTGHWINGRTGTLRLSDVITDIAAQAGLTEIDVTGVAGLVSGFVLDRPMPARAALNVLLELFDVTVSEHRGQVVFRTRGTQPTVVISAEDFVEAEIAPLSYGLESDGTSLLDLRITYLDAARDYALASVSARREEAETVRVADIAAPLALDEGYAFYTAERLLAGSEPGRRTLRFAVAAATAQSLSPGQTITVPNDPLTYEITDMDVGLRADIRAVARPQLRSRAAVSGVSPVALPPLSWISAPSLLAFDLPSQYDGLHVGVLMEPFRLAEVKTGTESVSLETAAKVGALETPLLIGPSHLRDRAHHFEFTMPRTQWLSRAFADVRSGANRFAVETAKGWEIIGIESLELIGPSRYRASGLLRGLDGSDDARVELIPSGARIIALDGGIVPITVDLEYLGQTVDLSVTAAGREGAELSFLWTGRAGKPRSPVHLRAKRNGELVQISWIPRSIEDSWTDTQTEVTARFELNWADQSIQVTGRVAELVIPPNTSVTVVELDPIYGRGHHAEIWV